MCIAGLLINCNTYMPLQDFSFSRSDRKRHIQIDFNWLCASRVFVKRYDTKREEATNILGIFTVQSKSPDLRITLKTQSRLQSCCGAQGILSLSILLFCCRWSMTRSRRAKFLCMFFSSTWTAELKKKITFSFREHTICIYLHVLVLERVRLRLRLSMFLQPAVVLAPVPTMIVLFTENRPDSGL